MEKKILPLTLSPAQRLGRAQFRSLAIFTSGVLLLSIGEGNQSLSPGQCLVTEFQGGPSGSSGQ